MFALVNRDLETYLNEPYISSKPPKPPTIEIIADVEEPELPPVKKLKKSAFESRSMFNERLAKMKTQRAKQIQSVMQPYKDKVDIRNQKVKELQAKYNDQFSEYKKVFAKYALKEKQNQAKHNNKLNIRRLAKNKKEQELLSTYFPFVFGKAKLKHLTDKNGKPKYNAETGAMHAMLYWGNEKSPINKKELAFKVNARSGKAEGFYNTLEQGEINPSVKLSFKGKRFAIDRVNAKYENKNYLANLNAKGFIAQKPVEISLGYKDKKLNKVQNTITLVAKQEQNINLQTSNIKDVQFEVVIDNELKEFNDK